MNPYLNSLKILREYILGDQAPLPHQVVIPPDGRPLSEHSSLQSREKCSKVSAKVPSSENGEFCSQFTGALATPTRDCKRRKSSRYYLFLTSCVPPTFYVLLFGDGSDGIVREELVNSQEKGGTNVLLPCSPHGNSSSTKMTLVFFLR